VTRDLRLSLIAVSAMLVIFLLAAIDPVRFLDRVRAENQLLREASVERSRRLSSIRTYILLYGHPPYPPAQLQAALARALAPRCMPPSPDFLQILCFRL
jgi:hypothetical protein